MRATRQRMALLAAALWFGSLTTIGFVVVPLLFRHLASPAIAGAMAVRLFTAQTWLGIACAMLILLALNKKDGQSPVPSAAWVVKLVVAGFLLALLVEFGVAPRIVSARAEGGNLRLWHGLGSAMYVGQWLCATFALWRMTRPEAEAPASPG